MYNSTILLRKLPLKRQEASSSKIIYKQISLISNSIALKGGENDVFL